MIGLFRGLVGLSSLAALVAVPAQGFAQYRDPNDALAGAVVGGAVGGVLGGVLGGWQQRQANHEERMQRERWRQAHGDQPYPGDVGPGGPPRPAPRAGGPRSPDFAGRDGDDPHGRAPRGRPAQFEGEGRAEARRGAEGPDGQRRPGGQRRRPAQHEAPPDEAAR